MDAMAGPLAFGREADWQRRFLVMPKTSCPDRGRFTTSWVLAAVLALFALPGRAEDQKKSPSPETAKWGFGWALGAGGAGGDFGHLFRTPISGDFEFFRRTGAWRFGLGVSYGSFGMQAPYEDEKEWGFLQSYVFATPTSATPRSGSTWP
jgi:hypothetical protein